MKYDFKHKTQLRVRYGETDQMGYCYYGNYAQYFEVGRVEALRAINCSYKDIENDGVMLPVREYHVRYLKPALYDDLLTVETKIIEIKGATITFEYSLFNELNENYQRPPPFLFLLGKKICVLVHLLRIY